MSHERVRRPLLSQTEKATQEDRLGQQVQRAVDEARLSKEVKSHREAVRALFEAGDYEGALLRTREANRTMSGTPSVAVPLDVFLDLMRRLGPPFDTIAEAADEVEDAHFAKVLKEVEAELSRQNGTSSS